MTAAITLAEPAHLAGLLSLTARFHEERGLDYDDDHRRAAAVPLLDGSPLGAVWLIGPARAPLGYVMITFGWSIPLAGMVGTVQEVFVRASVRKRGIGTEVMHAVSVSLREVGIKALQANCDHGDVDAKRFCARVGLQEAGSQHHMADIF